MKLFYTFNLFEDVEYEILICYTFIEMNIIHSGYFFGSHRVSQQKKLRTYCLYIKSIFSLRVSFFSNNR